MDTDKKIKCPQKTASSSQRATQQNRTLLYIKHQLRQSIMEISTFMPISKGQVTSLYPHPCQTMPRHVPNLSSPQGSVVLDMSVDPTQMKPLSSRPPEGQLRFSREPEIPSWKDAVTKHPFPQELCQRGLNEKSGPSPQPVTRQCNFREKRLKQKI